MLDESKIINNLRNEYFRLLPVMLKTRFLLESKIRWCLQSVIYNLKQYQRIEIKSRIKDCESAINSLRRRREGIFDPDQEYMLVELKDLVGFRVLVFPEDLISEVNRIIVANFSLLESDPILTKKSKIIAHKYYGLVNSDDKFQSEIQIVPMLVGLYWEVEHFALYKQDPSFKGIISEELENKNEEILNALSEFSAIFENALT
jgi:ppGpp synthetase/RelA/SpoT-type nucleotidyltranferase